MATARRERGDKGERLVATMLEQQGFKILERNYRKPFGEIDLIADNKELVLFVEVKLRSCNRVDLAELVGLSKQLRIEAAARAYLSEKQCIEKVCRFDVALVDISSEKPHITYISDAFQIKEGY